MELLVPIILLVTVNFTLGLKDVPVYVLEVLTGETIYLPCNVSTNDGDEVVLVLWYREDIGTPIYSVDTRGGISKSAKRWSDESVFGERAYFIFDKDPGKLSIQNTQYSDAGTYRCRVDFLRAQTSNSKIKLDVVSPPEQVIIRDDSNVERSTVVGPYNEGDVISLKCEVTGGKPSPQISWFINNVKILSETNRLPNEKYVKSEISLGPLGREDLNARITCRATNHPRITPIETIVQIDMNFVPLNIRLLGAHQPLSAGRRYDLLCQSAGSRPPAVITWWMNGDRLEKTTETTSSDGNQTTSTLSIVLNKSDAGKYLSCKAYNHAVPSEPLDDGWKLDIQYIPETYVRLGTSLDPKSIREGTDVYFDCLVVAHPMIYRVEWRHNGRPLPHNISQGVIISNHSLVLQGVTRATAGNYSCVGFNAEGEGTSPPFTLNILYVPTCASNQPRVYGVAKQEDAKIKCSVDANPPEVEFSWTFNNSAESIDVATNHIARSGTSSTVTYTPITELDYGTLLCVASNKIGKQRVPCIFHIIAAGRPDQVHNCTLTNISMTSLTVTCSEGFNGGLPQLFALEMRDAYSNEITANITSTAPHFTVSTLTPGSIYLLSIFAFNSKGRSDAISINAAMLKLPEKQLTAAHGEKPHAELLFSPVISLTIGLTMTVLVAGLALILALRIPCNSRRRRQKEFSNDNNSRDDSPGPSNKSFGGKDVDVNDLDDKNPDVIPEAIDSDDQVDCGRQRQNISTIDTTCSPNRPLHSDTPPPHGLNTTRLNLHTSHNLGYFTLRNGMQAPVSMDAIDVSNVTPHVYSKSIATCTLPRHTSQNMWPGYCGTLAGVRPLASKSTLHQLSLPQATRNPPNLVQLPPHEEYPVMTTSSSSLSSNVPTFGRTITLHHINQNQRGRICVGIGINGIQSTDTNCLSDEEATVQTPLMMKRESTV